MLKSKEELRAEILEVLLDNESLSATALSKEVGYTKLNARVLSILNELVEVDEVWKEQTETGYYVYSIVEEDNEEDNEEDFGEDITEETESNDLMPQETIENNLPVNCFDYKITQLEKSHVRVVFPELDEDGNVKSIILEPDERLLIINQNAAFRFVVQTPEDVLEAIHVYTTEVKITTYLVTDMYSGIAVSDVDNIDMNGISVLFLTIERYNKAGN